MRIRFRALIFVAVALLGASPLHAEPVLKIGVILSYSGQFADIAAQIDNGIRLYLKQHGDAVAGRKIEIVRRDVGGPAADVAKRLAHELVVREQVDIIAGFDFTPNALAAADISMAAKKFMVVMTAATEVITTKSPYIVRVSSTTVQIGEPLGAWAAKSGVKTLYTMVSDYGPGLDAEAAVIRAFQNAGGTVIGSVRMPLTNPDFSAFVQRAKDASPDGVFMFVPGGAQTPALAKSLVDRGLDPKKIKIMGLSPIVEESALRAMGHAAIGVITASYYDHNHGSAKNREFVRAYTAEFKRYPSGFSVGGYDGMHLIFETLKKTNGTADGESLIAAAKGATWESPRGVVSIDSETREISQTIYIRRIESIDNQLINVEIAKFDDVRAGAR